MHTVMNKMASFDEPICMVSRLFILEPAQYS